MCLCLCVCVFVCLCVCVFVLLWFVLLCWACVVVMGLYWWWCGVLCVDVLIVMFALGVVACCYVFGVASLSFGCVLLVCVCLCVLFWCGL